MQKLLDILRQSEIYNSFISDINSSKSHLNICGLGGSAVAFFLSALTDDLPDKTFLIITETHDDIDRLYHNLITFRDEDDIVLFPAWQTFLYGKISPAREILSDRMFTLERLIHGKRSIIITSIRALLHKILPVEAFKKATLHFAIGKEIELNEVIQSLIHSGYERVDIVEMKGDFSVRGGIIDIYPLTYEMPIRIELFGDEIDSIRYFDPITQRSTTKIDFDVWIVPMSEIILTPEMINYWKERTTEIIETQQSSKLANEVKLLTEKLLEYGRFDGIEGYLPLLYKNLADLWDYLPEDTIVIADDPQWLKNESEKLLDQAEQFFHSEQEKDNLVVSPQEIFTTFDKVLSFCESKKTIYISRKKNEKYYDFGMKTMEGLRGNFQMFLKEIENWVDSGYMVNIFSDNDKQAERMRDILTERQLGSVTVHIGSIDAGFICDNLMLSIISEDEMFGRYRKPIRRRKFKEGVPISSFVDLKKGDYIVHISHGIGIYEGIEQLKVDGKPQDFIKISY
ncbi:MAG: CarD family transcriptional regulator, partial [Candidatus Poribacteria bacterium]